MRMHIAEKDPSIVLPDYSPLREAIPSPITSATVPPPYHSTENHTFIFFLAGIPRYDPSNRHRRNPLGLQQDHARLRHHDGRGRWPVVKPFTIRTDFINPSYLFPEHFSASYGRENPHNYEKRSLISSPDETEEKTVCSRSERFEPGGSIIVYALSRRSFLYNSTRQPESRRHSVA